MSRAGHDAFNHAMHTANTWLADIGAAFDTDDRHYCQRTLRAWLHCLRDRLTIDAAAKFGAQLPELLRGMYYDGWEPHKVPVKYGVDDYVRRFSAQANIRTAQVPTVAATITEVIADHMSPGQLTEAFAEFPTDLRSMLTSRRHPRQAATAPTPAAPAPATPTSTDQDRMASLEDQIGSLTEAVRTLAHGLEDRQLAGSGIDQAQVTRAARLADEILIAARTRPTT
jgi:uncharacterized protein (DUF2267 family)